VRASSAHACTHSLTLASAVRGVLWRLLPLSGHTARQVHTGGVAQRDHELLPHSAQLARRRRARQSEYYYGVVCIVV
jgi:hypothetical protein